MIIQASSPPTNGAATPNASTSDTEPGETGSPHPSPAPVRPPTTARVRLVGRPFALSTVTTPSDETTAIVIAIRPPGASNEASRVTNVSATWCVKSGTTATSVTRVRMPVAGRTVGSLSPVTRSAPPSLTPETTANRPATTTSMTASKGPPNTF